MKVVSVNTHDRAGGAAKVALSLHRFFMGQGHACRFLAGIKLDEGDCTVGWTTPRATALRRYVARVDARLLGLQYLLDPSILQCGRRWFDGTDVVQLHNIHGAYFNPLNLITLSRRYPVIWTLHDMWSITGKCVHSYDCERWRSGCGECPLLHEYPELPHDTSAFHWRAKRKIYRRSQLTVVTPSRWLQRLVSQSTLSDHDIRLIPNGVDVSTYRPFDKRAARRKLGIPEDARLVAFSGPGGSKNLFKGYEYLRQALAFLPRRKLALILIGRSMGEVRDVSDVSVIEVGEITSEEEMALCYSAADVLALPSAAENCPLTVLEAMACGTPVVAFRVGGVPELVEHGKSGYLARQKDARDLAVGLRLVLERSGTSGAWGAAARQVVLREFTLERQGRRYLDLYTEIVEKTKTDRSQPDSLPTY